MDIKVETFASFGRTNRTVNALTPLCGQAAVSSVGGFHVHCASRDELKIESMGQFSSYCVLHALLAQQSGQDGDQIQFTCPAGLMSEQLLAINQASR